MISAPQGFRITSIEPIDSRFLMSQKQMRDVKDSDMPQIYFTICVDDSKLYKYDKANAIDPVYGKFVLYTGEYAPKINGKELGNGDNTFTLKDFLDDLGSDSEYVKHVHNQYALKETVEKKQNILIARDPDDSENKLIQITEAVDNEPRYIWLEYTSELVVTPLNQLSVNPWYRNRINELGEQSSEFELKLKAEIKARKEKDAEIDSELYAEGFRAKTAENALQQQIDVIDGEIILLEATDSELKEQIRVIKIDLDSETKARKKADSDLRDYVDSELAYKANYLSVSEALVYVHNASAPDTLKLNVDNDTIVVKSAQLVAYPDQKDFLIQLPGDVGAENEYLKVNSEGKIEWAADEDVVEVELEDGTKLKQLDRTAVIPNASGAEFGVVKVNVVDGLLVISEGVLSLGIEGDSETITLKGNKLSVTDTVELRKYKTNSITSVSTSEQYPSAKAVYDVIQVKQNHLVDGDATVVRVVSDSEGRIDVLYDNHTIWFDSEAKVLRTFDFSKNYKTLSAIEVPKDSEATTDLLLNYDSEYGLYEWVPNTLHSHDNIDVLKLIPLTSETSESLMLEYNPDGHMDWIPFSMHIHSNFETLEQIPAPKAGTLLVVNSEGTIEWANNTLPVQSIPTPTTGSLYYDSEKGFNWNSSAIKDVQVNGVTVISEGIANIPVATSEQFGAVKVDNDTIVISEGVISTHKHNNFDTLQSIPVPTSSEEYQVLIVDGAGTYRLGPTIEIPTAGEAISITTVTPTATINALYDNTTIKLNADNKLKTEDVNLTWVDAYTSEGNVKLSDVIDTDTSEGNILMNEEAVTSAIARSAGRFRAPLADANRAFNSTSELNADWPSGTSEGAKHLDYAIVSSYDSETGSKYFNRYMFTATGDPADPTTDLHVGTWVYQYTISTEFTDEQWDALNSGVTESNWQHILTAGSHITITNTKAAGKIVKSVISSHELPTGGTNGAVLVYSTSEATTSEEPYCFWDTSIGTRIATLEAQVAVLTSEVAYLTTMVNNLLNWKQDKLIADENITLFDADTTAHTVKIKAKDSKYVSSNTADITITSEGTADTYNINLINHHLSGTGEPTSTLGVDGDIYIDLTTL